MKPYNKISDEELAAYLEGMLSSEDAARIDAAMNVDTLEVLSVAGKALDEFPSDNVVSLPSWNNVAAASVRPLYPPAVIEVSEALGVVMVVSGFGDTKVTSLPING